MQALYKKFHIPNYDIIKHELISIIDHDFLSSTDVHSWTYSPLMVLSKCPNLNAYLKPRLKSRLYMVKFYCTPGGKYLGAHTDGIKHPVPFGMNLPLLNTQGTIIRWLDCPEDQKIMRIPRGEQDRDNAGYLNGVYVPKDETKLSVLGELELTSPAFIKTDIMHSVYNNTANHRLNVVFRWKLRNIDYSEPDQVIEVEYLDDMDQ